MNAGSESEKAMQWTESEKQIITEKIYAGLIGMDAGMRLGAPVENPFWTYERLRDHYGDIRGYLRVHKNHTADDDVNGPILLVRALTDKLLDAAGPRCDARRTESGKADGGFSLLPEDCGEAWLNYTRFGKGMFWWGGEDVSTEHRAYMNLRRGVKAPRSGSSALNGKTASEQIGGQIFSDTWGLICPGDPEMAASYARTAASVSHDGSGLDGAAFVAASVAAAFTAGSVSEIIDAGLRVIPADGDYAKVIHAVRAFHAAHPQEEAFRACRDYIDKEWGHDRFPGGWHIIPNAGICLTGLLYGGGDLGRSIEISVMCGFDTDCNASSIGTILGVFGGLDGVPERYRGPINDTVILSGISGYLNMADLPSVAYELTEAASLLHAEDDREREEVMPLSAEGKRSRGDLVFDFALPGSTHGLRLSERSMHSLRNVAGKGLHGKRCLELMIDGKRPGPADLFFTGCFIRSDLEDERYEPVFSPRVYPGQTVSCRLRAEHIAPAELTAVPYVTLAMGGRRIDLEAVRLNRGSETWQDVSFTIPDLEGDQVHELGWRFFLKPDEDPWALSKVFIDEISATGQMDYTVDFALQREEFGQITPCSFSDCTGKLLPEDGRSADFPLPAGQGGLCLTMPDETTACGCQAFTGNYYQRTVHASAEIGIPDGKSALLLLRGQGTRRYYALGLSGDGRAVILRYDSGIVTELSSAPYNAGSSCLLEASAVGTHLALLIDGKEILTAEDDRFSYGMTGLGMCAPGSIFVRRLHICGSCAQRK